MVEARDAAILELIERIRRETGRPVPTIDPDGPGADARVMVVLETPGQLGAASTGVLSPLKNEDSTASIQRRYMSKAGLNPEVCLFWNAVPWDLGARRKPKAREQRVGGEYLLDMAVLLPKLRAVLLCGRTAQAVGERAGLTRRIPNVEVISVPFPNSLGLYANGGEPAYVEGLRRTVEVLR